MRPMSPRDAKRLILEGLRVAEREAKKTNIMTAAMVEEARRASAESRKIREQGCPQKTKPF